MPSTRTPAPTYDPTNPLFVQPDRSILLETFNPRYAEARDAIAPFAELEKSPEHIHTYRISNLSLWNAAAAGFTAKQMLAVIQVGYPAEDLAGYVEGAALPTQLRDVAASGLPFTVRDYQREAADIFYAGGDVKGGSGVIVLPCGSGKTIVGIAAMALVQKSTLILTTSVTAVKQWKREILDKTDLRDEDVCEYTGDSKEIGPVTVATYQIITYRPDKEEEFPHFKLFGERDWGLIVYDEVHLLPAPVFRVTAQIQARRRLGLTATLVREDGREGDVFSLIGPKKYDVPWRELETAGWIAAATCTEIRVSLPADVRMEYAVAELRDKYRIASENPTKDDVVEELLRRHANERVIVIGQYISQLKRLSKRFNIPLITGATPNSE